MSRFKEWKDADGGHSLNRDFTVVSAGFNESIVTKPIIR